MKNKFILIFLLMVTLLAFETVNANNPASFRACLVNATATDDVNYQIYGQYYDNSRRSLEYTNRANGAKGEICTHEPNIMDSEYAQVSAHVMANGLYSKVKLEEELNYHPIKGERIWLKFSNIRANVQLENLMKCDIHGCFRVIVPCIQTITYDFAVHSNIRGDHRGIVPNTEIKDKVMFPRGCFP